MPRDFFSSAVKFGDIRFVCIGLNINTVGIGAEKRKEHGKIFILEDDAFFLVFFVLQVVAVQAVPGLLIMLLCGHDFKFQLFRQERIAVNLDVRMRHGYADRSAAVGQ